MPSILDLFRKTPTSSNQAGTKKSSQMAELFPVKRVEEEYFVRKDNKFCTTLVVSPVNMSLISGDEEDAVVEAIQEAVNVAPERMQILVSSERLSLDEYLGHLQKFIDDAKDSDQLRRLNGQIEDIHNRSVYSEKVLSFYLTIQSQFERDADAIPELMDLAKQVQDALGKVSMLAHRLNKHELLDLWYKKLNSHTSLFEPARPDMGLHNVFPSIIDTRTYRDRGIYVVDETYMKSYTVEAFPRSQKRASWLSPIFEMNMDIDVSMTLAAADKELTIKTINKSLNAIQFQKQELKKDAYQQKKLQREEESAESIMDSLSNDNENWFHVSFVFTLRAPSLEQLARLEKSFRAKISSKRMTTRALINYAHDPLWYTLPICYKGFLEQNVYYGLTAYHVGTIQPFNSSSVAAEDGVILGLNKQSHDFIIWGNAARRRFPHMIVLGVTGGGKSFFLWSYIDRRVDQNEVVIDLDPEGERAGLLPRENHIVFSLKNRFTCNPFHIRSTVVDTDNETVDEATTAGDYLRSKLDQLQSFFAAIYPQVSPVEAAAIDKAATNAYKRYGLTVDSTELPETFPTLSEFASELKDIQGVTPDLLLAISPYYGEGTYARMFDGQTNWGFMREVQRRGADGETRIVEVPWRYTRLDIKNLPERAKPALMDLLVKDIWEYLKEHPEYTKNVIADECHLLANPEAPYGLEMLVTIVKRGRKYKAHLVPATQNVGDLLRTKPGTNYPIGQAIISNSDVKLLFRLDEKEVQSISTFVGLSQSEQQKIIKSPGQGHGIILIGNQHAEIETFMTKEEWRDYDPERYQVLFETNSEEMEA